MTLFSASLVPGAWIGQRMKVSSTSLLATWAEVLLSLTKAICRAGGYKTCCVRRTHSLWGRVVIATLQSSTPVFVVPGSWDVTLLLRYRGNVLLSGPFCQ